MSLNKTLLAMALGLAGLMFFWTVASRDLLKQEGLSRAEVRTHARRDPHVGSLFWVRGSPTGSGRSQRRVLSRGAAAASCGLRR